MRSVALNLAVPDTDGRADDLPFTLDRNSIRQWIGRLPLANTGETVKQLYQTLVLANRCDLAPNDLLNILEQIHAPIEFVMKALHKHFVNAPHPLSNRGKRVAQLTAEINNELAIGYKHVAQKSAVNIASASRNPMLLSSLQRTLFYLNRLLITHYQSYTLPESEVWKEINQIYRYAEDNKLHRIEIENNLDENISKVTSISNTYKDILLLSIANPNRLDGDKIIKLNQAVENYGMLCTLTRNVDRDDDRCQFVVNLDQDSKPLPLALYKGDMTEETRILNTSRMTTQLKAEIQQSSIESGHGLTREIFKSLVASWEHTSKRKSLRTKRRMETEIAIGLTASHRTLDQSKNQNEILLTNEDDDATILFEGEDSKATSFNILPCTILNRSSMGYGMLWSGEQTQLIRVGELVAIKDQPKRNDPTTVWNICLVRWIQHLDDEEFHFGVQLLSRDAQPVKAKNFEKGNTSPPRLECLLVPADEKLNIPPSIITPGLFRSQQHIFVDMGSEKHSVILTRLLRSKASFRQFAYAIADEDGNISEHTHPDEAKKQTKKKSRNDDPFGNIWSSI